VASAGILANTGEEGRDLQAWHDSVDTMLGGVFFTLQAAVPAMLDRGEGGSIVITSSVAGLRPFAHGLDRLTPGELGYGAAKHGVVGLMRNYALALGEHGIRVNTVHPMGVRTPMVENPFMDELRATAPTGWGANVMGTPILEPRSITDAVLWLCSDEARYVTGVTLPVDAGMMLL
jgi:NAD(P)-dependent dehydrogenase (short-subunit alcohol dehydrogenase family)